MNIYKIVFYFSTSNRTLIFSASELSALLANTTKSIALTHILTENDKKFCFLEPIGTIVICTDKIEQFCYVKIDPETGKSIG